MIQGHLRRFPLFDDLSDADVARVEHLMTAQTVREGRIVIQEGDTAEGRGASAYLILEGAVGVSTGHTTGTPSRERTLGPGELFGLVALSTDTRRTATCRATAPGQVGRITRGAIEGLFTSDPALYARLQHAFALQLAMDIRAVRELIAKTALTAENDSTGVSSE